jgi:hypothetical protein
VCTAYTRRRLVAATGSSGTVRTLHMHLCCKGEDAVHLDGRGHLDVLHEYMDAVHLDVLHEYKDEDAVHLDVLSRCTA